MTLIRYILTSTPCQGFIARITERDFVFIERDFAVFLPTIPPTFQLDNIPCVTLTVAMEAMALLAGERHPAASAQWLLVGASRWLQSLALEILQSEDQPGSGIRKDGQWHGVMFFLNWG